MIGIVFADEGEAKTFHKKVKNQKNGKAGEYTYIKLYNYHL